MKHNSKLIIYPMMILGFLLFVTNSCIKESPIATKTIKVGVLLGFSGTGSQNAKETRAALDICLQDINAYIQRNRLDANIELIYEDTKSDTNEAKIKANLLINEGVQLIIGPYTSAEARAVKAIADIRNVLVVSHSAVSTSLAIPYDNFLRFVPCDSYQAEAVNAMFVSDSVKAIIPVVRNDLWSNSLIVATLNKFTSTGGVVISQHSFEPGTTDFSAVATAVKASITSGANLYGANKVAVYLISYADGAGFLEAMSNAGLTANIKIYGASAFAQSSALLSNTKAADFAINSNFKCPVFGLDEAAANIYEPIQARIVSMIGTRVGIYALAAYDILWTTAMTSFTQHVLPDFASFKTHFIETAGNYYGATGRTELDEYGDRKHVFYDFWKVNKENSSYSWKLSAKYNTTDHLLRKF